ncbi:MAG: PPC domain-containing protein [Oscillatoriophycideae cyanobacterium NC_groundwater_1537_Pr4_S-0.65um_50_18]|nr:PPC domain-containing protein [Oscillatoriophycideae cyanobacterium NC_groundwater_1537_Pr4_S-0.65um_50_18]
MSLIVGLPFSYLHIFMSFNDQHNMRSQLSDNRLSEARKIGFLNGRRTFRNFVGSPDKVDYHSFKLTGRSSFNLSLSQLQNNVDVFLLKAGRVIARSVKGGKRSEAIKTTLDAGTYFIRVNQKAGNSRYRLVLGANPSTPPAPSPSVPRRAIVASSFAGGLGFIHPSTGKLTRLDMTGPAAGIPLTDIAIRGDELFVTSPINDLYKVDANTGASTLIGNLSFTGTSATTKPSVTGLAFAPSGTLYATTINISFTDETNFEGLHTIDLNTGKASLVALFPAKQRIQDIVYDDFTERFFGVGQISGAKSDLYSIGLNGDIQSLGATGFSQVQGLLFENGNLYGYTWNAANQITFPGIRQGNYQATLDKSVTFNNGVIGAFSGAA